MKQIAASVLAGVFLFVVPVAVVANGLLISGPQGCKLLDGVTMTDAGPGVFIEDGHWYLDYEVMGTEGVTCWFDGAFSLQHDAGASETLTGLCESFEGIEQRGTFTLTYPDANSAVLSFTKWDDPLTFALCPYQ